MKLLILTVILVGISVFGLCFNIIFRKDGKFPDKEIEHNKEMRKRGIICASEQERKMWGRRKKGEPVTACPEEACTHCPSSCSKL